MKHFFLVVALALVLPANVITAPTGGINKPEAVVLVDAEKPASVFYELSLGKWKDPTSPPHVKKQCSKWFRSKFPRVKTCVGWTIRYKWIYRTAMLRVTTGKDVDIRDAVEKCLLESAVIAAVAGLATGGSAAAGAAELALKTCLVRRLGEDLLAVNVTIKTSRGGWE